MDTKARLEQAKEDKRLANLTSDKEIQHLEYLLAEAEKPKLRHGDYGVTEDGYGRIMVNSQGAELLQAGHISLPPNGCDNKMEKALGNIFDDLKAMQEPLKEFEMVCNCHIGDKWTVKLSDKGDVVFDDPSGDNIYMNDDQLPSLILNLQRMCATRQRKQANG